MSKKPMTEAGGRAYVNRLMRKHAHPPVQPTEPLKIGAEPVVELVMENRKPRWEWLFPQSLVPEGRHKLYAHQLATEQQYAEIMRQIAEYGVTCASYDESQQTPQFMRIDAALREALGL